MVVQTKGAALEHFVEVRSAAPAVLPPASLAALTRPPRRPPQWAGHILSSARSSLPSLSTPLDTLSARLALAARAAPSLPRNPRLPRLFLFLLGSVASSLYLVEHALWSAGQRRAEAGVDAWAVERWVAEGRGVEAQGAVERVLREGEGDAGVVAERMERELVYGVDDKAKL